MSLQNDGSKCKLCGSEYTNINEKWCKACQTKALKTSQTYWSEDERIDNLIKDKQLKINHPSDIVIEWIPYDQFDNVKQVCECCFASKYSATWKDGPLVYDKNNMEYKRSPNKDLYLKRLNSEHKTIDDFINEAKAYSINYSSDYTKKKIHHIFGISRDPEGYIMALDCVAGGDFSYWIKNYGNLEWETKVKLLKNVVEGLQEIHKEQMVHRNFHTGNILFKDPGFIALCISDLGLCRKVDEIYHHETKIYGVLPYVAPEVLRGKPYTQAADIYSLGMIMYFVATGRQPFVDHAHDEFLAMKICNGERPEISDPEAPKCYVELMRKCWDPNPDNRPKVDDVANKISLLYDVSKKIRKEYEIERQIKEAEEYRKSQENKENRKMNPIKIHPEAIYTSRLLTPFTKNLPKFE